VSDAFYSMDRLKSKEKEVSDDEDPTEDKLVQSFMNSDGSDDVETIKAMWAYNMPCVLLVNGAKDYWSSKI